MRQVENGKEVREEFVFCPENVPFLYLSSSISCNYKCFSILLLKTSSWYVERAGALSIRAGAQKTYIPHTPCTFY